VTAGIVAWATFAIEREQGGRTNSSEGNQGTRVKFL
jgi:hypothetical protein